MLKKKKIFKKKKKYYLNKVYYFNFLYYFDNNIKKIVSTNFKSNNYLLDLKKKFMTIILNDEQKSFNDFTITIFEKVENVFLLNNLEGLLDVYYLISIEERTVSFEGNNYIYYVCCYTNVYYSGGTHNEKNYKKCILFNVFYDQKYHFSNSLKKALIKDIKNWRVSNSFISYNDYLKAELNILDFISKSKS